MKLEPWKLVLLAIAPLFGVYAAMRRRKEEPSLTDLFAGLIGGAMGIGAAYLLFVYTPVAFAYLYRTWGRFGAQTSVVIAVLLLGYGAHRLKSRNQWWYGVFELAFAAACAARIAAGMSPERALLSQWVALGGTMYVVARGLNNISDAKKRKSAGDTSADFQPQTISSDRQSDTIASPPDAQTLAVGPSRKKDLVSGRRGAKKHRQ